MNSAGTMLFQCELSGPGVDESNKLALYRLKGGELQLIVRLGNPAPGFDPLFGFERMVLHYSPPQLIEDDRVIFLATAGPDAEVGIWAGDGNGIQPLVSSRQAPDPAVPEVHFIHSPFWRATMDRHGRLIFQALFLEQGVESLGLWLREKDGQIRRITSTLEVIDINGVQLGYPSLLQVNPDGGVLIQANLLSSGQPTPKGGLVSVILPQPAGIDSTTRPRLQLEPVDPGRRKLTWTVKEGDWVLEKSASMAAGSWQSLEATGPFTVGTHAVEVPQNETAQFFRLRRL